MSAFLLFAGSADVFAQTSVSGTVNDENGQPLIGATVMVEGAKTMVITDLDGNYTISVPSASSNLIFEYMGYASQTHKVGSKTKLSVNLLPDTSQLEEIVVIGYGEAKKTDLTGSVTNVKISEVVTAPVASVDQALQGRVAGADIMNTSGDPNATTSIRIRGTRSITASNEPLIVVDDVMDAVQDLSDLNPADIESISVLKDASSTAIYGARGANGVIIVTTKKGASVVTKPTVTVSVKAGVSMLARNLDVMNAAEFAQFRNEYSEYSQNYKLGVEYPNRFADPASLGEGTNWIKEITRLAPYQQYDVSVTGSTKKTNYYFSAGYSDIEGIVKDSGNQKFTTRFSITHKFNDIVALTYKTNFLFKKQRYNKADIGGTAVWTGATYLNPMLKPEDTINDLWETGTKFNNPVYNINLNKSFRDEFSTWHNLILEAKPCKGLTLKGSASLYYWNGHQYRYYPSTLPTKKVGDGGEVYRVEHDTRQITSDWTASYKNDFVNTHHFDALVGFSTYYKNLYDMSYSAKGMLVDDLTWNNLSGLSDKNTIFPASYKNTITRMSVMARLNYNYKKRYYLTFTARADGSSNFAANNKWGFFPSGAFKWNIMNEKWMKRATKVNELALRISAGSTGNDAITPYRSLSALSSSANGYLFNGTQSTYYYPSRLASPDLTWEKTDLYNIALDMAFFKERLKITIEGYLSYTRDLLLEVQKANQSGYSKYYENIGKTSNKGVELSIESRNIQKKNFGWTTSFTISHNKQMVEDIGSEDFVSAMDSPGNNSYMMYGYVKGKPLNSLWGFQYGGVWHSDQEIKDNEITRQYACVTTGQKAGRARYIDQNHDGILDQNDLVYLGDADPYVYGGLQNNFNYKNLSFGFYFTYSLGGALYNYSEFRMSGSYTTNQYRYMTNAWHPVRNPDSDLPAAGSVEVHPPSNLQVHDASYLRLKNINISYRWDMRQYVKWMKEIILGVSCENVWLLTSYNGFDPDVSTESSESTLRRVDMGAYPRPRTIIASLQLKF